MQNTTVQRSRRGFTLAELLVVITIIGVLAAMIVPAIDRIQKHVREGAARMECKNLEASMTAYCMDWGEFPPDSTEASSTPASMDPAQCLVYYLNTAFRVSGGFTRNGGPYYDFAPDRLEAAAEGPRFVDVFRRESERTVHVYQFDNNEREDGGETWETDPTGDNINVSNMHPTSVDIWSAGDDGKCFVYRNANDDWPTSSSTDRHPTQSDPEPTDFGDDIGNW